MRHAAPFEQVTDLVGPRLGRIRHDRELMGDRGVLARPLVQELGDDPVELLVGVPRRLQHVVIDPPGGHRVQERVGGRAMAPGSPVDQERPLRVRMQAPDPVEHLGALLLRHPDVGEHQRDRLPGGPHLLQPGDRGLRRVAADDPIVLAVAAVELAADARERRGVVVDRDQDRLRGAHERSLADRPLDFRRTAPRCCGIPAPATRTGSRTPQPQPVLLPQLEHV